MSSELIMPENSGLRRRKIPPVAVAALISALFFIFGIFTLDDFGITWDEPVHFASGDLYLDKILDRDQPVTFTDSDFEGSMQYYGPVFDIWGALNHRLLTENLGLLAEDNARHLHLLLTSALTVFFTYLLVQRAISTRVAVFAVLFLTAFPRFIGHSFNNPKDIPLTFIFVITIYLFYLRLTTGKKRFSLLLMIAGGVGFATRIQYFLVPVVIISYIIVYICINYKTRQSILYYFISFWDLPCVIILSFSAGMLFWPYLWTDPLLKLRNLLEFYLYHRTQARLLIRYCGSDYVPGLNLPWHYAPVMLAITTPLITLGNFLFGCVCVFMSWIKARVKRTETPAVRYFYLLLLLWIVIGILPFILPGQRVYGGIRHFLFITPVVCVIAGIGLDRLTTIMERKIKRWSYLVISLIFLLLFISVYSYHPYYTVYYNSLVGGPKGAYNRFSLENWGNAYKGPCRWLNKNSPRGARVLALVAPHIPRYYLRPDIRLLGPEYANKSGVGYDYSVYILRNEDLLLLKDRRPVFSLTIKGQPICNVHRW